MRTSKRRLPLPQWEFGFAAGTFNLVQETTQDGERITREREEAGRNRKLAEAGQPHLFWRKPGEKVPAKMPAGMPANPVVKGLNRVRKSKAELGLTVNANPV
jgi:hypothetical protein